MSSWAMNSQDNNNKSTYVAMSHNVNNLVYHFVTPAKYRRIVFDESVEESLREIKKKLWGGQFWTDGYFVSTCGRNTDENTIRNYVKNQGRTSNIFELF